MTSISRQLGAWVSALRYEDLPEAVRDRARGVTLHALSSALLGHGMPEPSAALAMMRAEEAGGGGAASTLVDGTRLSRAGAALVNAELIFAGGKWDTFRMLTHPGVAVLPAALAVAETEGANGQAFITAVVAGYEVMARLAAEHIPTVMARGFHAGPVFGIFGAAVAAAKLQGLDAAGIHATIAQCVNLASGNLEGARSGGRGLREGGAVRNALLAVALARHGTPGGETTLEGAAGFYHAYAGSSTGALTYSFSAATHSDLDHITAALGDRWFFLETLYRIYSAAGYNIAHVDVTAALCAEHGIAAADIERIHSVVNWLETEYPSPAFPSRSRAPGVGSTHYYAAYGAVCRGFPLLKNVERGLGEPDPPQVLDLLQRVTITPSHRQPLFAPAVTVHLRDGRSFSRAATGDEFIWDFDEAVRRLQGIGPGLPITPAAYERLTEACRHLQDLRAAAELLTLTRP